MAYLCALTDARLASVTVDELARVTGCDARLCEVRLNARRDRVAQLARGEVAW